MCTALCLIQSCDEDILSVSISASEQVSGETPEIVILMAENRPLIYTQSHRKSKLNATPLQYVAAINAKYARTLGYRFRWYSSPCFGAEDCFYDDYSRSNRFASWAKIIAINETLTEYTRANKQVVVFYLDSDAFVSDHSLRLTSMCASLAIWEDEMTHSFCSGVMLFRNTPESMEVLQDWWHGTLKGRNAQTVLWWEQRILNNNILSKYGQRIVMLPSAGWTTAGEQFWDSGVVAGAMNKTAEQSYAAEMNSYRPFVRHMWAGKHEKHLHVIQEEFQRVEAALLSRHEFHWCPNADGTLSSRALCLL